MGQKILFFDIDGTLIERKLGIDKIPEGVVAQLRRLQAMGHKLFISSGRPRALIEKNFLDAGFDGFIMANGGCVEIGGQSIFENHMDYELAVKTCDMLEELGLDYMIETAGHIYIRPEYKGLISFFASTGRDTIFTYEFDRDEVLHRAIKVECNNSAEDIEKIESFIKDHFGYVMVCDQHGSDHAFEIYSPTISKASGIQEVLRYYGADQKDTYAFGDGTNDIEMFQACHTTVAMGNAVEELKEIATMVCRPIQENGLEDVLRELFPE